MIRHLAASRLLVLADKLYKGAGKHARVPHRGRASPPAEGRQPRPRPATQPGRTGQCPLKVWRILQKLRCYPWRTGLPANAIHVLQTREIEG
jgi:hypothetical protein